MSSLIRVVVVAALVGASGFPVGVQTVRADAESFVAFGGGISGVSGHTSGFYQSLELTLGWIRRGKDNATSVPLGEIFPTVGFSAGTTFRAGSIGYTYGEIASFVPLLFVFGPSVGIGAGRFSEGNDGKPAMHAFVGVTLPLRFPRGQNSQWTPIPYLAGYYRPQIVLTSGRTAHELGVLLKILMMGKHPP